MPELTLPGAESHYPPDLEVEPFHLDLDLKVAVESRRLAGTVTHTLRARSSGHDRITLHAVGFEEVEVKALDGSSCTYRYDGREIHVAFDLDPGSSGDG